VKSSVERWIHGRLLSPRYRRQYLAPRYLDGRAQQKPASCYEDPERWMATGCTCSCKLDVLLGIGGCLSPFAFTTAETNTAKTVFITIGTAQMEPIMMWDKGFFHGQLIPGPHHRFGWTLGLRSGPRAEMFCNHYHNPLRPTARGAKKKTMIRSYLLMISFACIV
jgi:hypothetical protein